jgi:predicted transcriptional regulator
VRQYGNVALKLKRRAGADMKNTIIRENLSIEDAKNVAEELKMYGYMVEITGEGKRRTVTATKENAK